MEKSGNFDTSRGNLEKTGKIKGYGYGSLLKSLDVQNFIVWSTDFIGL